MYRPLNIEEDASNAYGMAEECLNVKQEACYLIKICNNFFAKCNIFMKFCNIFSGQISRFVVCRIH